MDTYIQLQNLWKDKHFNHLQYCLENCTSYFEDHFEYQGIRDKRIMIDGEYFSKKQFIEILANYYDDVGNNYQTSLGDTVYLFFTDLVEDDVDILLEIDEEVA